MGGNNSPTTEELLSGGNRSGTGRYIFSLYFLLYVLYKCILFVSYLIAIPICWNLILIYSGGTPEQDWYDPSEPRYCICNQVSYGDMVACDNEDVSKKYE